MKLGHLARDLEMPGVPLEARRRLMAGDAAGDVVALTGSGDPEVGVARHDGTVDTFRPLDDDDPDE